MKYFISKLVIIGCIICSSIINLIISGKVMYSNPELTRTQVSMILWKQYWYLDVISILLLIALVAIVIKEQNES